MRPEPVTEVEESLLGCCLLSSDALRGAVEHVGPEDFYVPLHQVSFAAMRSLYERGAPVDAVALHVELQREDPRRIHDASAFLGWMSNVPSLAHAQHYAQMVVQYARLRRMLAFFYEAQKAIEDGLPDPDELFETVLTQLKDLDRGRTADGAPEALTMEELAANESADAPWVISGLLRQDWRCLIVAPEGKGKAIRVAEHIPTPTGWTTMGALRPGDRVFAGDGSVCNVVAVSETDYCPDAMRVRFSDGSSVECHARHEWATVTYDERQRGHRAGPVEAQEIAATLWARGGHTLNHAVPVAGALALPDAELPIPPYVLGVWLGDGATDSGLLTLNRDVACEIEARLVADGYETRRTPSSERSGSVGVRASGLQAQLRAAGLLGHKHVPDRYLRGSISQRRMLLEGLMDTDGWVVANASRGGRGSGAAFCELTFTCKALIDGALELIRSLGVKVSVRESDAVLESRVVGPRWRMRFQSPFNPFSVSRKASRWVPQRTRRASYRYITAVEPCDPSPMRCIEVDSSDGTYLCGDEMIPTHNSTLLRQIAQMAAQGVHPFSGTRIPPVRSLIVDLENPIAAILETGQRIDARLRIDVGDEFIGDRCRIWHKIEGLDLRNRTTRRQFERELEAQVPQLVVMGPAYKLVRRRSGRGGAESYEEATEPVLVILDDLRVRFGFALVIEHHAPKAQGTSTRSLDPYGSQRWLAWPELGLSLRSEPNDYRAKVEHHRGARLRHGWPSEIIPGGNYPFAGRWETSMHFET